MKLPLSIVSLFFLSGWTHGFIFDLAQNLIDNVSSPWRILPPPDCIVCIQDVAKFYFQSLSTISPDCAAEEIQDFEEIPNRISIFYNICKNPYGMAYKKSYKDLTIYGEEVLKYFMECFKEDYKKYQNHNLQVFNKMFNDGRIKCGEPDFLQGYFQYFVSLASHKRKPKHKSPSKGHLPKTKPPRIALDNSSTQEIPDSSSTYVSNTIPYAEPMENSVPELPEPQTISSISSPESELMDATIADTPSLLPATEETIQSIPNGSSIDMNEPGANALLSLPEFEPMDATITDTSFESSPNDSSMDTFNSELSEPQPANLLYPAENEALATTPLASLDQQSELESVASSLVDMPSPVDDELLQSTVNDPLLDTFNLDVPDSEQNESQSPNVSNSVQNDELTSISSIPPTAEESELGLVPSTQTDTSSPLDAEAFQSAVNEPLLDTSYDERVDTPLADVSGPLADAPQEISLTPENVESEFEPMVPNQSDQITTVSQDIADVIPTEPSAIPPQTEEVNISFNDESEPVMNDGKVRESSEELKFENEPIPLVQTESLPLDNEHLSKSISTDLPEVSADDSSDTISDHISSSESPPSSEDQTIPETIIPAQINKSETDHLVSAATNTVASEPFPSSEDHTTAEEIIPAQINESETDHLASAATNTAVSEPLTSTEDRTTNELISPTQNTELDTDKAEYSTPFYEPLSSLENETKSETIPSAQKDESEKNQLVPEAINAISSEPLLSSEDQIKSEAIPAQIVESEAEKLASTENNTSFNEAIPSLEDRTKSEAILLAQTNELEKDQSTSESTESTTQQEHHAVPPSSETFPKDEVTPEPEPINLTASQEEESASASNSMTFEDQISTPEPTNPTESSQTEATPESRKDQNIPASNNPTELQDQEVELPPTQSPSTNQNIPEQTDPKTLQENELEPLSSSTLPQDHSTLQPIDPTNSLVSSDPIPKDQSIPEPTILTSKDQSGSILTQNDNTSQQSQTISETPENELHPGLP